MNSQENLEAHAKNAAYIFKLEKQILALEGEREELREALEQQFNKAKTISEFRRGAEVICNHIPIYCRCYFHRMAMDIDAVLSTSPTSIKGKAEDLIQENYDLSNENLNMLIHVGRYVHWAEMNLIPHDCGHCADAVIKARELLRTLPNEKLKGKADAVRNGKCKSFILVDGSEDETYCGWPEDHLGCHSSYTSKGIKIKWIDQSYKADAVRADVSKSSYNVAKDVLSKIHGETVCHCDKAADHTCYFCEDIATIQKEIEMAVNTAVAYCDREHKQKVMGLVEAFEKFLPSKETGAWEHADGCPAEEFTTENFICNCGHWEVIDKAQAALANFHAIQEDGK